MTIFFLQNENLVRCLRSFFSIAVIFAQTYQHDKNKLFVQSAVLSFMIDIIVKLGESHKKKKKKKKMPCPWFQRQESPENPPGK